MQLCRAIIGTRIVSLSPSQDREFMLQNPVKVPSNYILQVGTTVGVSKLNTEKNQYWDLTCEKVQLRYG